MKGSSYRKNVCRGLERRMRRVGVGFASALWSEVRNCCSLFKCLIPLWKFLLPLKMQ